MAGDSKRPGAAPLTFAQTRAQQPPPPETARLDAKRVWTPEEQAEKLAGYMEIQPHLWHLVRYGTHVRYYKKDGTFVAGGFVGRNPADFAPADDPATTKRSFVLHSSPFMRINSPAAAGKFRWTIAYEDVARLFIRPDISALLVQQSLEVSVSKLNENIRTLVEFVKKLGARVEALEQRR